jgi:hypothetical protein
MSINCAYIQLSGALALALFTTSASGQSSATKPNSTAKGNAAAQETRLGSAENEVAAEEPQRDELKDEIDAVKAEMAKKMAQAEAASKGTGQ